MVVLSMEMPFSKRDERGEFELLRLGCTDMICVVGSNSVTVEGGISRRSLWRTR